MTLLSTALSALLCTFFIRHLWNRLPDWISLIQKQRVSSVGSSVPSVAVVGWQVTCAIGRPGPGPATGPDLDIAWRCHCIGKDAKPLVSGPSFERPEKGYISRQSPVQEERDQTQLNQEIHPPHKSK